MPEFLTGVITPMFTACDKDGRLDETGIRSQVRWLKDTEAVTSLFVRSGVGKMKTFTPEETKDMARVVIDEAGDDLHVLVGASGDFSKGMPEEDKYIEESLELGAFAEELGAEAAVFVTFGLELTDEIDEKMLEYFTTLNDSLDLPIVIYQPGATPPPFRIKPELLSEISSLDGVKGMKLSTNDMKTFADLSSAAAERDFTMICGAETSFLPSLVLGAGGVIGEGCNTYPQLLRFIYDRYMDGDLASAAEAQFRVNRTLAVWEGYGSAEVGKSYLARKGVDIQVESRGPRVDVEKKLDRFEKAIDELVAPYRSI